MYLGSTIPINPLKVTASICLFLLIAHGSLYYLSQEIIIVQSKIEAHFGFYNGQKLKNSILVTVVPKGAAVNDEISLHGRLYDIVKTIESPDSIYCYGFEDESEQEANLRLASSFQHNNILGIKDFTSSAHHRQVLAVDQLYVCCTPFTSSLFVVPTIESQLHRVSFNAMVQEIITPPPELFS